MYAKATIAFSSLEFFTTHQWKFISNNPIRLMEEMSTQDKKTFYFDVREIEWKSYFDVFIQGARRFVLKEDPSTLPLARRNLNRYILVINYLQYKLTYMFYFLIAGYVNCTGSTWQRCFYVYSFSSAYSPCCGALSDRFCYPLSVSKRPFSY